MERSGYLLESKIAKELNSSGFFVETNQTILDPFTGKNREIDIIATYFNSNKKYSISNKCSALIRFIFEVKNNIAPIVLLTEFESSPYIEDWLGLKQHITIPKGINYTSELYYERLINENKFSIFTQYCSFQKKKGNHELMALHPDNIHSGLSKITQYCEEAIEDREMITEDENGYLRDFLYMPILLINDNLYELKFDEKDKPNLTKKNSSILIYNYHNKLNEQTMAYIHVVTKKGFPSFMKLMIRVEEEVESALTEIRYGK